MNRLLPKYRLHILQHFLVVLQNGRLVDVRIRICDIRIPQTLLRILPALINRLHRVTVRARILVILDRRNKHIAHILWRLVLILRVVMLRLNLHVLEVLITDGHNPKITLHVP